MLPHSSLKASSGKFFAREGDALPEDPTAAKAMRRALGNVAVGLHARVASVEISASDLLSIATGDIVKLGPARGVTLYADDVPLHQCSPGRDGGKRAVQLGGNAR
jgi:flagellar motor switch protein FliM